MVERKWWKNLINDSIAQSRFTERDRLENLSRLLGILSTGTNPSP